ncbi:MAG: 50S ribosomal protein L29 [Bryobacteraceae bacterium]
MKAEKFRGIDLADLQRQVQDSHDQLFRFRFQMGMGQMEGLKKYRNLKKDRARMLTVVGEKHAAGETSTRVTATKAVAAAKSSEKKRKK